MLACPTRLRSRARTAVGMSLDGLLASQIRENEKAAARESGTDYIPYDSGTRPRDLDLPLVRCTRLGVGDWHWAATFAWPEDEIPGPHVQCWSARPDQHALSQISDTLSAHLSPRQGRYRAAVMRLPLTVARAHGAPSATVTRSPPYSTASPRSGRNAPPATAGSSTGRSPQTPTATPGVLTSAPGRATRPHRSRSMLRAPT